MALNLFFSALFLNPPSSGSNSKNAPKKIICFVKFTNSQEAKLRKLDVSENKISFVDIDLIVLRTFAITPSERSSLSFKITPSDLSVRYCSLLI